MPEFLISEQGFILVFHIHFLNKFKIDYEIKRKIFTLKHSASIMCGQKKYKIPRMILSFILKHWKCQFFFQFDIT